MPPAVSVIVPVWNSEPWLEDCLQSISNQTLRDIEIICVNDACTDQSLAILQKYAETEPRLQLIALSKNVGEGVARNIALEAANGEYLGFVDSDDAVAPDFFQLLYDDAIKTGADIARGFLREYTFDNKICDRKDILESIRLHKAYFVNGFFAAIYKTHFIRQWNIKFQPHVSRAADIAFSHRAVAAANFVTINEDAAYLYCRHENRADTIQLTLKKITDPFNSFETILNFLHKVDPDDFLYNKQLSYIMASCINAARRAPDQERAKAANLCASKIMEVYNICKDKDSFSAFVKSENSPQSRLVKDILSALQERNLKKIEFYIHTPSFEQRMHRLRKSLGQKNQA